MASSTLLSRLRKLWAQGIWAAVLDRERSFQNRFFTFLRIVSITLSGLSELKVASRAAALSYSTLLGFGPLVAIAVLVSSLALGNSDPALAANGVSNVISFIAPQVGQYQQVVTSGQGHAANPAAAAGSASRTADPEMVKFIESFIANSRSGSGTAGVVGLLALLVVVVLLFTNVEKTFDDIWGVRRGRNWITRIIYYWAVISIGALVFFTSLTLFSAGAFLNVYITKMPLRQELAPIYSFLYRSGSALLLILILTLFYRIIPNTRVKWWAALVGAVLVTILLFLNNYLAFLYIRNIVMTNRLYGALGLLPILMLGLYVFWLFVLIGGQITYALQNVHYRSSQTAWHSLNHATRESMSLLVLVLISRRFKACQPPYSVTGLAQVIRLPAQMLNESLNRLCDLRIISELPPGEGADPNDHRYLPARPLDKITLAEFRQSFEDYGEAPSSGLLDNDDPLLAYYREHLATCRTQALGQKTLEQLLDEFPQSRETNAPFAIRPAAG